MDLDHCILEALILYTKLKFNTEQNVQSSDKDNPKRSVYFDM